MAIDYYSLILLISPSYFLFKFILLAIKGFRSRLWILTKCEIVAQGEEPTVLEERMRWKIKYRYTIQNKTYERSQVDFSFDFWNSNQWADIYPVGSINNVYCNPEKPGESVLMPGFQKPTLFHLAFFTQWRYCTHCDIGLLIFSILFKSVNEPGKFFQNDNGASSWNKFTFYPDSLNSEQFQPDFSWWKNERLDMIFFFKYAESAFGEMPESVLLWTNINTQNPYGIRPEICRLSYWPDGYIRAGNE